jgi:hypothetical protein
MSGNAGNRKAPLIEIAKAVGLILGIPLALFAIVSSVVEQPIIALVVALITAVLASVWVVRSSWTGITEVVVAWMALALIVLAGFVIWPRTMTVEGTISDTAGNPVSNEVVVLFDRSDRHCGFNCSGPMARLAATGDWAAQIVGRGVPLHRSHLRPSPGPDRL